MTRSTALFVVLAAVLCIGSPSWADDAPAAAQTEPAPATAPAPVASPTSAAAPAAPVHFDAEAATAAYLAQLSPEARAKSDAYFEGGYWMILWDFLIGLVVAWIFLGTGLSAKIRDWAERVTRFRFLQTALYSIGYILISSLILLPWGAYEGYFREHKYGMSNQDMTAWLTEQGKGLAIGLVFGSLLIAALYAVVRKIRVPGGSGARWF